MALLIQDILEENLFPGARLAAGKGGIRTPFSWVNVMEIMDSPDTVQPGELLVTTGYGLEDSPRYQDLIGRLKGRGVSGMAIQPYYISSIPDYLLAEADKADFPVLRLPPDLTFSEILHVLYHRINMENPIEGGSRPLYEDAADWLKGLSGQEIAALFSQDTPCSVHLLLLQAVSGSPAGGTDWAESRGRLLSFLSSPSLSFISGQLSEENAVILAAYPAGLFPSLLFYDLNTQLALLSGTNGTRYYIGTEAVSDPDSGMSALRHALSCIDQLRQMGARRGVCAYSHLSFIKALGTLRQGGGPTLLEHQALSSLNNHDRANGTSYVRTLRIYLAVGCNVTRAASYLFIHRHTLLNWLDKITALTGLDLTDYYTRTHLSLSLLLQDYYTI